MSNTIDRYVTDLKILLDRRLPADRVNGIIKEAEAHLGESVQRRIGPSVDEMAATRAAIEAYGKAETVALGFLERSRLKLCGMNPMWWACLGALVTICSWNCYWLTLRGYFDNSGDVTRSETVAVAGILGLVLLVVAVREGCRSYRRALTWLTLVAAGLSILLMSYWMIPAPDLQSGRFQQGISRLHLKRDFPIVLQSLVHVQSCEALLALGLQEFATAKSAQDLATEFRDPLLITERLGMNPFEESTSELKTRRNGMFVVPRTYGAFIDVCGPTTALQTAASFDEAKKAWADSGPIDLAQVRAALPEIKELIGNATAAKAGRLFFFHSELYMQTVFYTFVLLPVFLLLDGFAAWTARPKQKPSSTAVA